MGNASALELAAAHLDAVLDANGNPTILTDGRGTITRWNKAAEEFYGYSSDEAVGQPVAVMCAVDPAHDSDEELRRACGGDTLLDVDTVHRRRDGISIPVSLTIAPVRDGAGAVVGTVRVTRNVTAFERAERAVRRLGAVVGAGGGRDINKDPERA